MTSRGELPTLQHLIAGVRQQVDDRRARIRQAQENIGKAMQPNPNAEMSFEEAVEKYRGYAKDDKLLRLPQVLEATGFGRSKLYDLIAKGQFPKPVKLGERTSAWSSKAVQGFIQQRIASEERCDPPTLAIKAHVNKRKQQADDKPSPIKAFGYMEYLNKREQDKQQEVSKVRGAGKGPKNSFIRKDIALVAKDGLYYTAHEMAKLMDMSPEIPDDRKPHNAEKVSKTLHNMARGGETIRRKVESSAPYSKRGGTTEFQVIKSHDYHYGQITGEGHKKREYKDVVRGAVIININGQETTLSWPEAQRIFEGLRNLLT